MQWFIIWFEVCSSTKGFLKLWASALLAASGGVTGLEDRHKPHKSRGDRGDIGSLPIHPASEVCQAFFLGLWYDFIMVWWVSLRRLWDMT